MTDLLLDQDYDSSDPSKFLYGESEWFYHSSPRILRESSMISIYESTDPISKQRYLNVLDSASVPNNYPFCYEESFRDIDEDSSHCGAFKFDSQKEPISLPELQVTTSFDASGSGEKSPGLDKKVKVDDETSYVNHSAKRAIVSKKKKNQDQNDEDVRLTQNYIGNICFVFVTTLLEESKDKSSEMHKRLTDWAKYHVISEDKLSSGKAEELISSVLDYATKNISGKVNIQSKTGKSSRQYKVGSRESISQVFYESKTDDPNIRTIKKLLQSILIYFFNSKDYPSWISKYTKIKCSKKKEFLIMNGKKFEQIFLDPRSGRMNFSEN